MLLRLVAMLDCHFFRLLLKSAERVDGEPGVVLESLSISEGRDEKEDIFFSN